MQRKLMNKKVVLNLLQNHSTNFKKIYKQIDGKNNFTQPFEFIWYTTN